VKSDELKGEIWRKNVPKDILERLSEPHSKERPGLPFAWMVSYTAEGALQNMQFFENGVRHCKLEFPIRVFMSNWTDAIVITFVPLEAIKEIHVMEWSTSFYEVPLEEAKRRLIEHPRFPYDGRNPDTVRAEIIVAGGWQKLVQQSRKKYADMGIRLPEQVKWSEIYDQDA
jgi:hypothetical protein